VSICNDMVFFNSLNWVLKVLLSACGKQLPT
jgi:hypothetical protein